MEERSPSRWEKFLKWMLDNLFTNLLLFGVALGCLLGISIRINSEPLGERESKYLGFPGEILINVLKCAAIPLIMSCIIVALGSLDMSVSKTLGWQLIVYIILTKIVAGIIGLAMAIIIQPGRGGEDTKESESHDLGKESTLADVFLDMFRNIITQNMVNMYLQQRQTKVVPPENNTNQDINTWNIDVKYIDSMNILGMIVIAIIVGLSLSIIEDTGKLFLDVVTGVYGVSMKVVIWILWVSPICLFFLILTEFLRIKDLGTFLTTWGTFILAVNAGYLIIIAIMNPLIFFLLTRSNVFKFYADVSPALITAFVTASSMATMPVLIDCLLKHGVDTRVVRFLVPIGANLNKDGTASFLALSTVFVAQMTNVELSVGHYFTVLVLSIFGSIATTTVPFGAVILLAMVVNGLGLKMHLIGGILAVEWINDRGQTLTNISSNCIHPKVLEKLNKKLLKEGEE